MLLILSNCENAEDRHYKQELENDDGLWLKMKIEYFTFGSILHKKKRKKERIKCKRKEGGRVWY